MHFFSFFLFFFYSFPSFPFILFLLCLAFTLLSFPFFPFLSFPSLFNSFLLNLLSQNRNGIVLINVVISSLMRLFSRRVSIAPPTPSYSLVIHPLFAHIQFFHFLIPYFTHCIPSCPIPIIPFRDLNSVWGFLPTTK